MTEDTHTHGTCTTLFCCRHTPLGRVVLLVVLVIIVGNAMLVLTVFLGNTAPFRRDSLVRVEEGIPHSFVVPPETVTAADAVDLGEFWEVWGILEREYVPKPVKQGEEKEDDGITQEEFLEGAIQGLTLATEDVYTNFLPVDSAQKFREEVLDGEVDGVIGAYIGFEDDDLTIRKVITNSPAERSGLMKDDVIREIEGVASTEYTLSEAIDRIRGKRGTPVVLTIFRPSDSTEFIRTLIRDRVEVPSIETEVRDGVFVIRLLTFTRKTPGAFHDALRAFVREANGGGADRILLDLRGNTGGVLSVSVYVAGLFLPDNSVVLHEYNGTETLRAYRTRKSVFRDGVVPEMTVLVDSDTASASEILAVALRHYGVADIVGIATTGKGSVQTVRAVGEEGSLLKITTAHWLTPDKEPIPSTGIVPDVDFREDFLELVKTDTDADFEEYALERAIGHLRGK